MRPAHIGPLPEAIGSILRQQITHANLTVEAALAGDRKLALRALLTHPSVTNLEVAEKILDDFLRHESKYLPQFE